MATITSAFDILDGLTVEEMLANPEFIPNEFRESLTGSRVTELFFNEKTIGSNLIGYKDATASYLEDDEEEVSEFGEIPVASPSREGEARFARIEKHAVGLRVSWESRKDNETVEVKEHLDARRNSLLRKESRDALAAFNDAPIQELVAETPWNAGGDVASDFLDAQEMIIGATDVNGDQFTYVPNILWINPLTLSTVNRNETMQKLYIGDLASENPIFKPISANPLLFGHIQVAPDFSVDKDTAYLGVQKRAGFLAQREPRQYTDFYAERGDSNLGGANMSYRSDTMHRRGYGVNHPKSVVKLTGLMS